MGKLKNIWPRPKYNTFVYVHRLHHNISSSNLFCGVIYNETYGITCKVR